ncbi:MAG: hypothetical protein ACI857_002434, partial [Arenicella sp.]
CPKCSEQKLFIKTGVAYFQVNGLSLFPRYKFADSQCRGCGAVVKMGDNENTDHVITKALEELEIPKKLYIGLFLYPLAIVAVLVFINAF